MRHTGSFGDRRIIALAVLTCLNAAAAFALPEPHMRFDFGMLGLTRGQTARLNVINLALRGPDDSGSIPPPDGDRGRGRASDPEWLVELSFVGPNGEALVPAVQHRLVPGQSAFVDLSFIDVTPPPDGDRVQIRAVVRVLGVRRRGIGGIDNPDILPSLELMDAETGRTQVFLTPGSTRFIKEVDPAPQP